MEFDPVSFYNLVKEMYTGSNSFITSDSSIDHAFRRTLVSRIYYSILLQIAKKYDVITDGIMDSHNAVIESIDPRHRNKIHNMKNLRLKADYNLQVTILPDDIDTQLQYYDRLVKVI